MNRRQNKAKPQWGKNLLQKLQSRQACGFRASSIQVAFIFPHWQQKAFVEAQGHVLYYHTPKMLP